MIFRKVEIIIIILTCAGQNELQKLFHFLTVITAHKIWIRTLK